MTENPPTVLGALAANNDVVIVSDPSHTDEGIPRTIKDHLGELKKNNVKHLFIEQDPQEMSPETLATRDVEWGRLTKAAIEHGMQVHLYDDRSRHRERDARFPDEVEFMRKTDPYRFSPETLIKESPNPEKMQAYLQEEKESGPADMAFRNQRMTENIDAVMKKYASEGAVVVVGSAHLQECNDINEGLRARGHRVTTALINTPQTNEDNLVEALAAPDKPDFVVNEKGELVSFKNPKTQRMQNSLAEGETISWKNTEPVGKQDLEAVKANVPINPVFAAALAVDCSWAKAVRSDPQDVTPQELGQKTPPSTPNYNGIAEIQNAR